MVHVCDTEIYWEDSRSWGGERETEPGAKAFLAWKGINMTVGGNRDSDGWGLYSYIETHL